MISPVPPNSTVALNLALALIACSDAPVLLLDGKLAVVGASASFCRTFKIKAADITGRPLAELGAGEWNMPRLSSLLNATAAGFSEVEGYEMDLERKDGDTRRVILNAKKLDYAGGNDVRILLTISDITDIRIAEKFKEDLLREKQALQKELHNRVANSLQVITSVLMQNARRLQAEGPRGDLYDVHQKVVSIAALQQQLVDSGPGDVALRPYFTALCESIGASMIPDPRKLVLDVTGDESVVPGDTSISLGLIVTELVINALKHGFPGGESGKITVDYHSRGPNWTLSVRDNGAGMPAVPNQAKAGLGSSIVEALVRQLGASLDLASANPGTTVSVVHTQAPVLVGETATAGPRAV